MENEDEEEAEKYMKYLIDFYISSKSLVSN